MSRPTMSTTWRTWELRDDLRAYDATYVAVAEALGAPLVTADGRLARRPRARMHDHRRAPLKQPGSELR